MEKRKPENDRGRLSHAAASLADDTKWFEGVIERTKKLVYGRIRRMISDSTAVDDLVQETFLKAWKKRGSFDRTRNEIPWILRIAERLVIDRFRSTKARKRPKAFSLNQVQAAKDGNDWDSLEPQDFLQKSPIDELVFSEAHAAALLAIEKLKPKERELFGYQQAGLTHAEISELTGRTENAINIAMCRIRKELRSFLGENKIS